MSENEQRERELRLVEARLIADVCAITAKPLVEAVESNFAGFLNELGIAVRLRPEASDQDVIALQNELLEFLNTTYEVRPQEFTWMVAFSRGGTNLRSLFPGDSPRCSSRDLESTQ